MKEPNTDNIITDNAGLNRRRFLQVTGGLAGLGIFVASCTKTDNTKPVQDTSAHTSFPGVNDNGSISLGQGDVAILNYFYLISQVKTAFYLQALQTPYSGITSTEREALTEIYNIDAVHETFLRIALGEYIIPQLPTTFSGINFTDRSSVLGAAITFQDLSVSAFNGACRLFTDSSNILLSAKMVSVEARSATYVRSLLGYSYNSSGIIDGTTGQDVTAEPSAVLPQISNYLLVPYPTKTPNLTPATLIDAYYLPTY